MRPKKKYATDDTVCHGCIEDHVLAAKIRAEGVRATCALCGRKRAAVTITRLAEIVDPVIREHFFHGRLEPSFSRDDDSIWEEQQGEDLSSVVSQVISQYLDCNDALVEALVEADPADPRDGDEPFYDESIRYEETPVRVHARREQWLAVQEDLKHRRRFFSVRARTLFDWLFEDLDDLTALPVDASGAAFLGLHRRAEDGVIHDLPPGTTVFRARAFDSPTAVKEALLGPATRLGPPPSDRARSGRMNPAGVSVFYGALEADTCLAELQPSIGGHLVVGGFATTAPLRVLDFHRLARAYRGKVELSYFQADFLDQVERRKFLRELHRMISLPVLPGHEEEYLITQTLAEYVAYVRQPGLHGLLYQSTQRASGTNVVLFPDPDHFVEGLKGFSLEFIESSAEVHRTDSIEYTTSKLTYSERDGIVLFGDEGDDWWEDDD